MRNVDRLKKNFEDYKEAYENGEYDEQPIYDLEEEIQDGYSRMSDDREAAQLEKLSKEVKAFKRENGFYDEETELDLMFPDRHEEGFDEDSMSWDSVFGDD